MEAPLRLNLGCGSKLLKGYINVDKYLNPDVKHDLEVFPWPWPDNSVTEILLFHVLEHLGRDPDIYLGIFKEIYRICQPNAEIRIVVPFHRHDDFSSDPTHVRAITPFGLALFSKKLNREWVAKGYSNSTLGIYLGVDFEITKTNYMPSDIWFKMNEGKNYRLEDLLNQSLLYCNLIKQIEIFLRVIK